VSADSNFPSNTTPADVQLFPAAYYLDIDFDLKKDLLVAPNANNVSENENSVWFYKNLATNQAPVFVYQDHDWLQGDMIDHGLGSVPLVYDVNQDGLNDLLVANYFAYKPVLNKEARIAYYQNIGTATAPQLILVDQDFLNLASSNLGLRLLPAMGDLNGDTKPDIIIGRENGQIAFYLNASTGSAPNFQLQSNAILDANNQIIQVPLYAAPQLFDFNKDGLLDLIVGHKGGTLYYYKNTGTSNTPVFTLETSVLGGVNVQSNGPDGFAVPHLFDFQDTTYLMVGALDGRLHFYDSISTDPLADFHERSSDFLGLSAQIGAYAAAVIGNLDNDPHLELFVGQDAGGLFLLENEPGSDLHISEITVQPLQVFPNPTKGKIAIKGLQGSSSGVIYNLLGQKVLMFPFISAQEMLDITALELGTYILKLDNGQSALFMKH
jgi:hypothetical protein